MQVFSYAIGKHGKRKADQLRTSVDNPRPNQEFHITCLCTTAQATIGLLCTATVNPLDCVCAKISTQEVKPL